MEYLNDLLKNEKLLRKVMIKELKEVKKHFGSPRLTQIEDQIEEIVIDKQQMIPNERVMVTISRDGYLKRVSMRSYGASSNDSTGIKEGDELIGYREASTLDTLLYVTSAGTYGYTQVYEIEEGKWKDIGSHLNSKVNMSSDEKIIAAFILPTFDTAASIVTLSKGGMIKRTHVKDLEVSRNNKTMSLMNLKQEDCLISAVVAYDHSELIVATTDGFVSRYALSSIAATSPKGKGIIAMKGEAMASLCALNHYETYLYVLCENGAMKRMKMADIPLTARAARGESICKKVKSHPMVIKTILASDLQDELVFMQDPIEKVLIRDVSLMNKEATFSNTIKLNSDFYLMKGIGEIELREEDAKKQEEDITQIDLNFE